MKRHPENKELSILSYRILFVLATLHEEFISSANLSNLVERLSVTYKDRVFRSSVRRSLTRMSQAGLISMRMKKGSPVDITLNVSGYCRIGSCKETSQTTRPEGSVRLSSVALPVVVGTYLMMDKKVMLKGKTHLACRADYLIHQDGTACLQLSDSAGTEWFFSGNPLAVASWYRAALKCGLAGGVWVCEGSAP